MLGWQVQQVGWDGSLAPLCSLAGGGPSALLACLADRLLVARGGQAAGTPGGKVEVASHYLPLLHPLLYGWATLAASNILPGLPACLKVLKSCVCVCVCVCVMRRDRDRERERERERERRGEEAITAGGEACLKPASQQTKHPTGVCGASHERGAAGGLWRARQEMGHLLRSYDCSCADQTLLTALSKAGCADVAALLAANPQASKVCCPFRSTRSNLCIDRSLTQPVKDPRCH